jgi:hypothetical protein
MRSKLLALGAKGLRIPFSPLKICIQTTTEKPLDVVHQSRVRQIEKLLALVPELTQFYNPAAKNEPLACKAFLEFVDGYVPLVRQSAHGAHLRNLLLRLNRSIEDEAWKKRINLLVAASNFKDGVPDSRLYAALSEGTAAKDLDLPDDALTEFRAHEANYGAKVPFFEFMRRSGKRNSVTRGQNLRNFFEAHRELVTGKRVLHFAPERAISDWFRQNSKALRLEYQNADLFRKADLALDVTALDLPDNSVDVLICHRVLEHVLDDLTAMREFHRVIKPGGFAQLSVPQGMQRADSTEFYIADATFFGHVRSYGRDFQTRLESVGFRVELITWFLDRDEAEHRRQQTDPMRLYHCWKDTR